MIEDSLEKEGRHTMAVQEQKAGSTLENYIAAVRSVWGDGKDPQLPFKVKALMEKLFASTSPDDPWMAELIRDGKPSRELYRDPDHGFIQMGHIHKQGHGNQPHDHGPCWVVYGSYKGVTEITKYKRTDDASQPGIASVGKRTARPAFSRRGATLPQGRYSLHQRGGRARRRLSFPQLRLGQDRAQSLQQR